MTDEIAVKKRPGRPPKYPWERWLDGRAKTLTQGKDFDGKTTSVRLMLLQHARTRGLEVRTELHEDRMIRVTFPGSPPGENVWPLLSDATLDRIVTIGHVFLPRGAWQGFPLRTWRAYLDYEMSRRGRAVASGEHDPERDQFRFTLSAEVDDA